MTRLPQLTPAARGLRAHLIVVPPSWVSRDSRGGAGLCRLLRVLRALMLAGILLLCASAPARAGEVSLDGIDIMYWVTFEDTAGRP